MKLRLWRNQSIRVNKKAPLLADQNQNAGHQRQDAGHDHGDTDVKERHDSNKDEIDGEQQHSEIFGDVHASFLRQRASVCTLKKAGEGKRLFIFHHEGHEDHGDQFFCTGDRRASDPRNKQSPRITRIDANQEKGFALPKGPPIGWTRVATATELRETEQKFLCSFSRLLA